MNHLLIVDPDVRTRESLRAVFGGRYTLSSAVDPEEAEAALAVSGADLVIVGVPPSGTRALAFVRKLAAGPDRRPLLVLGATPVAHLPEQVGFLLKPFDVEDIRRRVAGLIGSVPLRQMVEALADPSAPGGEVNLEAAVNGFERKLIVRALQQCNGVQTQAARRLGTTRRILRYRMDKLGIDASAWKQSGGTCHASDGC